MQRDRSGVAPGQSRRRVLGGAAAGALGLAAAACGPATGGGSGGNQAAQSKGPVTIEVLTRNGVASPDRPQPVLRPAGEEDLHPGDGDHRQPAGRPAGRGREADRVWPPAGRCPDGSWFGVVADGNAGREQANRGIFKPLDDLAKKDTKFDIKPYFKSMMDAFTVNGKLYALPTHAHYGTHVLYYNKNLTDAAGVRIPEDGNWTQDEFIDAAKKLTKPGEDMWGYWPVLGLQRVRRLLAAPVRLGVPGRGGQEAAVRQRSRPAPPSSGSTTPRPSSR